MKNDRKLVVYLICVGFATVFWFLNALNKEYSVELTFPVKYTNFPENKVLANTPPDHFILKVNSYGFTILRHKLSMAFSPLIFNVNEFTNQKMENSDNASYTYTSKQFIAPLSEQVSNELQIEEIQPDTITFNFDRVVSRKVKVHPNVSYELTKQHYLSNDITTQPDSVMVSGPESVLDTLKYISTKYQDLKELDQTTQRNVYLEENDKLTTESKRVVVIVPIEVFTEKQLYVPITINNKPDSTHINLFPDKVKVTFMTGLSRFSEIIPADFKISVSYDDIQNKAELLELKLEEQPSHIISATFSPDNVEYLIEKKND